MVNKSLVKSHRFFLIDNSSKLKFSIDTGFNLSVFPRRLVSGWKEKSKYVLLPVNSQSIDTYGPIHLTLNLNLCRDFVWRFIIADVDTPIIGADFLNHYDLLVDIQRSCLRDKTINQDDKY